MWTLHVIYRKIYMTNLPLLIHHIRNQNLAKNYLGSLVNNRPTPITNREIIDVLIHHTRDSYKYIYSYLFRWSINMHLSRWLPISLAIWQYNWGPFYKQGLTLIQSSISNHIHYKVWYEITYPFPSFNGATVEVWEWMSNFISHFTGHVITYPCWDLSQTMLVKGAPGRLYIKTPDWLI